MENQERAFKGVWIPKEIWLDTNLSALDKAIYAEIDSLSTENGCYASNGYLAEFCQCSEVKVSRAISTLRKLGYIELASFNGRQRVLKVCLIKKTRQSSKKDKAEEPSKHYYNDYNSLLNNKEKEIKEKDLPFSEELNAAIKEWFVYKKEKRQSYTAMGKKILLDRLKEMVEKHNETYVAEVIRYSMSQNWQGIHEPRLTENKNITKQSLLPDDSWLPE